MGVRVNQRVLGLNDLCGHGYCGFLDSQRTTDGGGWQIPSHDSEQWPTLSNGLLASGSGTLNNTRASLQL
jgi:hypothetical protein